MLAKQTHLSVAITMFSDVQLGFFLHSLFFGHFHCNFILRNTWYVWLSKKRTKIFTDWNLDSNFIYTIQ